MDSSQIYILISIIILLIIAALLFFIRKGRKNKKEKTFTPLAGIAFAFVLAGTLFWDNRLIGYILVGIGVLVAIADIIKKLKKK